MCDLPSLLVQTREPRTEGRIRSRRLTRDLLRSNRRNGVLQPKPQARQDPETHSLGLISSPNGPVGKPVAKRRRGWTSSVTLRPKR